MTPPMVDIESERGSVEEHEADDVRALVFARAHRESARKAQALLERSVGGRARAWAICALCLGEESVEAKGAVEGFDASDPWALFASACLLHAEMNPDALERSSNAVEGLNGHDDAVWLRALVLAHRGELEDIVVLHERPVGNPRVAREVDLLVGQVLAWSALAKPGGDELERALAMADEVRRDHPEVINAWLRPAEWLSRFSRHEESLALAEAAVERAPQSETARTLLWNVLLAASHVDGETRRGRIVADLERMLAVSSDDPKVLLLAATYYGRLDLLEERDRLWARIEAEFPGSRAEESVAWARVRELMDEANKQRRLQDQPDPMLEQRVADGYRALLERPHHHHPGWLGGAYIHLFLHERGRDQIDAKTLRELVEGMVAHDQHNLHVTHGDGARALAKHPAHADRALELAEDGIERVRARLVRERKVLERTGSYEEARAWWLGDMYHAKADVLRALGRIDEAGQVLELAAKTNGDDERIFVKIGELARERGDYEAAEVAFMRGLATRAVREPRPAKAALERMYVERHGSKRGLAPYLRRIEREDRARRKAEVLASALDEPRPLPDFDLVGVTQERRDSKSLDGKIALVHFWSMYCGPCVRQMNELEQLIATYQRDPSVEVVVISNDGSRDEVAKWLADNGHAVPMLIDDGYANRTGIRAWPTTLFVDRSGNIRFESVGSTPYILEEYAWRIGHLREPRG